MGAPDRYITVDDDGTIHLHEENDGWSFLRNPQHQERVVSLEELKVSYPKLYEQALVKVKEPKRRGTSLN